MSAAPRTALLFVGQGSQEVGMGVDLAASCPCCAATLAEADDALGFPLTGLMAEGPEETLRLTENAQPALLAMAVAHARHLAREGIEAEALAGHSLGQYGALVAAGALRFADALRLVRERGRLMQEAVPAGRGAMAAVLGMDRDDVYAACERAEGVVGVACHNAPGQTVISGEADAVAAVVEACEEEGAFTVALPVSAPFHSRLLEPMVDAFRALVDAAPIEDPSVPVIDNVTAEPLTDAASVRRSLVEQVMAPVRFEESLRLLSERGVERFVQCGPGDSAVGFVKRTCPKRMRQTFEQVRADRSGVTGGA